MAKGLNNNGYVLFIFSRKSGKVVKCIEGISSALLRLYALNSTSATRDSVIVNKDDNTIDFYCEGKKNDMPTICKEMEGMNAEKIGINVLEIF